MTESGLVINFFAELTGLPLHPLVVHFAVVLLPFAATALIALVAVRRWRARYGVLTVAVAAAGTAAALLAKESGEWLAERDGDPGVHAVWGVWLPVLAVIHLIVAVVWLVIDRRARVAGEQSARGGVVGAASGVLAVLSALVLALTLAVGHSGAQAVWGDPVQARTPATATPDPQETPTQATSTSPGTPTISATQTPRYTMAEVAQHASADSCWTAVDGGVYDVTAWIGQHPGGRDRILGLCGKDGTAAFTTQHGSSQRVAGVIAGFRIGDLG